MNSPQLDPIGTPSLSDAINKLMANPEIISMVASTLGNMPPPPARQEQKEKAPAAEEPSAEASVLPPKAVGPPELGDLMKNIAPMMSLLGGSGKSPRSNEENQREALLCALKPYVSEGRREAIDHIIRISQVSDILKSIQKQP